MSAQTLGRLFERSTKTWPTRTALRIAEGSDFAVTSYAELGQEITWLGAALIDLGVEHGDRVAIFSGNRPEWLVTDLACLNIGAVTVPLYQTSTPHQVHHILADSGAKVIFVAGLSEAERVGAAITELSEPPVVISYDAGVQLDESAGRGRVTSDFARLLAGRGGAQEAVRARADAVVGSDLATLIYTSGTTGEPKGVMLTHDAFLYEIEACVDAFPLDCEDEGLAFLPLSHSFERAWSFLLLSLGAQITLLPDPKRIAEAMPQTRANVMVSVPRLYEQVYAVVHQKVAGSKVRSGILKWALEVGRQAQLAGDKRSRVLTEQLRIADKLVFSSIREAIGGPKKLLSSGGAPLRQEVAEFFWAAGILINEGYGLTEAAPLITFNRLHSWQFGTVGQVLPGGELKIVPPPESTFEPGHGEIWFSGPNIMLGYWNKPEATSQAIVTDPDGKRWLRTGDVGWVDEHGYLRITDRMKDLIVTEGGKNVAPGPIEAELVADPLIEYAVVIGDNKPCLTALIRPFAPELERVAGELGVHGPIEELVRSHKVRHEVHERVARATEHLPGYEQIRGFTLVPEEFTMDNGMLTPTLKVKRREAARRYAGDIKEMYDTIATRSK